MLQFNIKEHINDFIKGKYAVNCKTEKLADEFLSYCNKLGIKWCTGETLVSYNQWEIYKQETSYHCNQFGVQFSSVGLYERECEYIVIEFAGLEDTYVHVKQPKPPLGVMPKDIYELKRVQDLCRALYEYSTYEETNYELMIKWSDELQYRLGILKFERSCK